MGCCVGASYGNWCKNFKTYYTDENGNEYCIFHAPAKHKIESNLDFVNATRTYIQQQYLYFCNLIKYTGEIEENEYVINFSGAVFPIEFNTVNFLGVYNYLKKYSKEYEIDIEFEYLCNQYKLDEIFSPPKLIFDQSKFQNGLNFRGGIFHHNLSFNNCVFYKNSTANFVACEFDCDVSFIGSYFLGRTDFSLTKSKRKIDFRASQFGDITFLKATFEHADFRQSVFEKNKKPAVFSLSTFNSPAHFESSAFYSQAKFDGCNFKSAAIFGNYEDQKEASFYNTLSMRGCIFDGVAFFCNCIFKSKVDFSNSTFNELSNFFLCQFPEEHQSIFMNCKFNDYANFSYIYSGEIIFNIASFNEQADFSEMNIYGDISLYKTSFKKHVTFNKSTFFKTFSAEGVYFESWAILREVNFKKFVLFNDTICDNNIIIEKTNLSTMIFTHLNIESFKFIDCKWGKEKFSPVYDELHRTEMKVNNSQLEEIYRRLKKNAKSNTDEMQASYWHYCEKRMQKKISNSSFFFPSFFTCVNIATVIFIISFICFYMTPKVYAIAPSLVFASYLVFLLTDDFSIFKKQNKDSPKNKDKFSKITLSIYDCISGYGENPVRAFKWLFVFITCAFFMPTELFDKYDSAVIDNAALYLPIIKANEDSFSLANLVQGFWRLLITFQTAIFAFALRNKLRR